MPREPRIQATPRNGASRLWPVISRYFVRLLVHLDALRLAPATYLCAVWTWLCGKRLRARLALTPLLGRSRFAYQLWRLDHPKPYLVKGTNCGIRIVAIIKDGVGLEATRASLAREQIEARVISNRQSWEDHVSNLCNHYPDAWLMELHAGETLAPGAGNIYRNAAAAAGCNTYVIYADDDLKAKEKPHFKPDWNAELFKHHDYITGASIIRYCETESGEEFSKEADNSLVARGLERTMIEGGTVTHLPNVLHHRIDRPAPRRPQPLSHKCEVPLPSISVIIPTRNRHDLLATCLSGLVRTLYPGDMEIMVVDNGSDDPETQRYLASLDPHFAKVIRDEGPFNFSALNNHAVNCVSGELLCFLNNDIEIREPGWLKALAFQAIREDVGAVGAQLLYPDGRIQHAGVVLGIGGGAAHAHRLLSPDDDGYFLRHALPQFVSAVTAACLVVKKNRFQEVGGFDVKNFAVSFNDVDLCLKLNQQGWQSFYEPRAVLVHHESVSRGRDRDLAGSTRQAREVRALQDRWGISPSQTERTRDPYHHPALSLFSEAFVVDA